MSISPATKARLMREMSLLAKDPPPGIAAYSPNPNDMTKIRAQITGPEGSPFENGIFLLNIHIAGRYPFEPPRCRFLTPIYHPNIDSGGRICLDTLKSPPAGSWSPAVSLPSLLLSIRSLMAEPNPDDGLVPEISELYKRNPDGWSREAKRRTLVEATMKKMEEVEASLDGIAESTTLTGNDDGATTGNETSGGVASSAKNANNENNSKSDNSKVARSSTEVENVENGIKSSKRSKLSSRR